MLGQPDHAPFQAVDEQRLQPNGARPEAPRTHGVVESASVFHDPLDAASDLK